MSFFTVKVTLPRTADDQVATRTPLIRMPR
jgi:hypothetical protein